MPAAVDTLLVTPLPIESTALRQRLGLRREDVGWRNGRTLLIHAGVGPARAAERVGRALNLVQPRALLLLGLAGGAVPHLQPGDLRLIASAGDGQAQLNADPLLLERGRRALAACQLPDETAVAVERDRVLQTPADKAAASGAGDLVDMETATVYGQARQRLVPCLAARVIFDAVDEHLLPVDRLTDDDGRLRAAGVLWILTHPWVIPTLIGYGRRARRAAQTLARFAEAFIAAGRP